MLIQKGDEYSLTDLDNGFRELHNSNLLNDFLSHVFASHIAYHVARMACAMSIQPFGFAYGYGPTIPPSHHPIPPPPLSPPLFRGPISRFMLGACAARAMHSAHACLPTALNRVPGSGGVVGMLWILWVLWLPGSRWCWPPR